jgi:hypothetical protein
MGLLNNEGVEGSGRGQICDANVSQSGETRETKKKKHLSFVKRFEGQDFKSRHPQ